MPKFAITLRGIVECADEVEAIMIADVIQTEGEKFLEEDDGDDLSVTQVTSHGFALTPDELIDRLLRTRNDLIKTRVKECWDTAKVLDQTIHGLRKSFDPMISGNYSHGDFMDVATAILQRGEYPL